VPTDTTWQQDRGRLARLSKDLPAKHPDLVELRRAIRAKRLEEHVAKVVAGWPRLSDQQLDRIAELLRVGGAA
jgi:hypothetical protein